MLGYLRDRMDMGETSTIKLNEMLGFYAQFEYDYYHKYEFNRLIVRRQTYRCAAAMYSGWPTGREVRRE